MIEVKQLDQESLKDRSPALSKFNFGANFRVLTLAAISMAQLSVDDCKAFVINPEENRTPIVEKVESNANQAVYVENVGEMIDKWSPDNRFFIRGEVPILDSEQKKISNLLNDHTDWTVLVFKDEKSSNYENIIYRLDNQLTKRYDFQSQKDPNTDKESGAIMVIYLDHTGIHGKTALYASKARDDLDLGDKNWEGGLDHFALQNLKPKLNVAKAITETVSGIDNLYIQRRDGFYINHTQSWVLGIGTLAIAGIYGLYRWVKSSGGGSYSSSNSSGSFFYFGGDSGGGGGGYSGGDGGGGGGFGDSGF